MAVLGPIVLSQSLLMMAGKPKMLEGGAVGAHRRPKTTVPGWRERLLCCKCGSREVDKVVTGTERAAGLFGRSPIVHWRYRFTGGGKRIRTRSSTVVFAVGPAERETISIGAAENYASVPLRFLSLLSADQDAPPCRLVKSPILVAHCFGELRGPKRARAIALMKSIWAAAPGWASYAD